jgi:hypothetical protein
MRIPKPKSAPGIFLWFITIVALGLLARIAWVLVGQNIEIVSSERGYDKLLSQHWSEILDWLAVNGFWLSLATAALIGGAVALWINVILQPSAEAGESETDAIEQEWQNFTGRTFRNEVVMLDYRSYIGCTFYNVTFVYDGGPTRLERNEIHGAMIRSKNSEINSAIQLLHEFGFLNRPVVDEHGEVPRSNRDTNEAE